MKDKIKAVLEELESGLLRIMRTEKDVDVAIKKSKELDEKALSQLDALYKEKYLGLLPKEKDEWNHDKDDVKRFEDGEEWAYEFGFNSAIQEMRERTEGKECLSCGEKLNKDGKCPLTINKED